MCCMCKKCSTMSGVLLLVIGLFYLGQNLSWWNFWYIDWYTVVFLLVGFSMIACKNCPDCQACCGGSCEEMPAKGKKK